MSHVKKILAATTLGESSDHIVTTARTLARATGAELYFFHAYAILPLHYGSLGMTVVYPESMDSETERVQRLLEAQLRRLQIAPNEVTGRVFEIGPPHRLITEVAGDLGVDLILVGASETHGPLAPLVGSTADRVLRQSSIPVCVLRRPLTLPLSSVMAPTDLSELSYESLQRGLGLLANLADRRPRLETLFVLSHVERMGSVQFSPAQVDRFARRELDALNRSLRGEIGWEATGSLRTGQPREEIIEELARKKPDLVVIGTHGRSGFERFLMGSVAADVVRHADCNVLVVPPAEAGSAVPQTTVGEEKSAEIGTETAVH